MLFIGIEVEQETSAPPPKKNSGSAPGVVGKKSNVRFYIYTYIVNVDEEH